MKQNRSTVSSLHSTRYSLTSSGSQHQLAAQRIPFDALENVQTGSSIVAIFGLPMIVLLLLRHLLLFRLSLIVLREPQPCLRACSLHIKITI